MKGSDYKKLSIWEIIKKAFNAIFISIIGIFVVIPFLFKKVLKGDFGRNSSIKNSYKKGDFKGEYYRSIPNDVIWENLTEPLTAADFKKEGLFGKQKQYSYFKILDVNKACSSKIEEFFFSILKNSAAEDKVLVDVFKTNFKNTSSRVFNEVLENHKESVYLNLSENDLINNDYKQNSIVYTDKGLVFSSNLIKFYNYLKDFTLLNEREVKEVLVWKDFLIYATLFGLAEEIIKVLNVKYPELAKEYKNEIVAAQVSSNVYTDLIDMYKEHKRYSGLGGSSSISGGFGSFGGGSGGGTR